MYPPLWTDDHERLVRESAPAVPASTDADLARVWNRVAGTVTAPEAARRRRGRIAAGVGVATVVLGVSGVAAANVWDWTARTGEYNTDAESIRLGGPGELIDPRGSDYEQVLLEEIGDIPFPSDEAHDLAVAAQVAEARRDAADMRRAEARGLPEQDYLVQHLTGGMRSQAARQAHCAWANAWAAATVSGDPAGRAEATEMLEEARTWPAVTDVDADQAITWKQHWVTDEAGRTHLESYRDNTVFGYFPLVVEAAHGHDLAAMGRPLARYTACLPELMPDLPSAVPAELRGR
jgi:hypothetical protein